MRILLGDLVDAKNIVCGATFNINFMTVVAEAANSRTWWTSGLWARAVSERTSESGESDNAMDTNINSNHVYPDTVGDVAKVPCSKSLVKPIIKPECCYKWGDNMLLEHLRFKGR